MTTATIFVTTVWVDPRGPKGNDRHRRPLLAPPAPHQPRPASREAPHAMERGGVVRVGGIPV